MSVTAMAKNTPAFFVQAAISFGVAAVAVGIGIAYLPVDRWVRGFLGLGSLFLVSSAFTLAKVIRDKQEDAKDEEVRRLNLLMAERSFSTGA